MSTKQIGTLQADTDRRGALASTKTDLGPSRQTQADTHRRGAIADTKQVFKTDRRGAVASI